MVSARRGFAAAFLSSLSAAWSLPAAAQTIEIPEIVVTPNYSATPLGQTGSSVSVIGRQEIARASPSSVMQLFRRVPGVTVIESGGPGGSTELRLRGAESGHTLVLVDGVRVNDFATARDDFDFAVLSLSDIERIEILKGPQSALYGSDAMGGVVNIITRKPAGTSATASVEGGSYGTYAGQLSGSASKGDYSVRLGGSYFSTDGFSRRGDRDKNEADGTEKWAGSVRATYAPANGPKVDVGVNAFHQKSDYDSTSNPDALYSVERLAVSGFGRLTLPGGESGYEQSVTAFFLDSTRDNREPGASIPLSKFDATSAGTEYQGRKDLGGWGSLLVGARIEHETASNSTGAASGFTGYDSERTLYAGYALHQVEPVDNLHLTFGARYDGEIDGEGFLTGRVTAAYDIPETGTTLRASVGTGAKRATAYQLGNNDYAAAKYPASDVPTDIEPEKSIGVDFGVEQSLFDGALNVSATAFYNRFEDLIAFESIAFPDGYYENIDRAETAGIELAARADILPGLLRGGITYTYLHSRDLDTGDPLPRRPEHSASFDLTLIGSDKFEATLSGVLVGERLNSSSASSLLEGYGRIDLSARYFLSASTEIYGRIENLTDEKYEDPLGYNAPGTAAYVGVRWTR